MKKFFIIIVIILFFLTIIFGLKLFNNNNNTTTFENTINDENNNQNTINETESPQTYNISGTYEYDNYAEDYYCFRLLYIFDNGYVETTSDGTSFGTYTIEGNKLYISYYKTVTPEGNPMETLVKERTFTIIDNATLVSDEGYSIKKID